MNTITVGCLSLVPRDYTGTVKFREETRHYKNGLLHREDGPAIQSPEWEAWYLNGLAHREDGPARTGIPKSEKRKKLFSVYKNKNQSLRPWLGKDAEKGTYCYKGTSFGSNKAAWEAAKNEDKGIVASLPEIKVELTDQIPEGFTGIVEFPNGRKHWLYKGMLHNLWGPAVVKANGEEEFWVINKLYSAKGHAARKKVALTTKRKFPQLPEEELAMVGVGDKTFKRFPKGK